MLQQTVGRYVPAGIPGMPASLNPVTYAGNLLVKKAAGGDPNVAVGKFVFPILDDGEVFVTAKAPAVGTVPLGIVRRSIVYPDNSYKSQGTLEVPEGSEGDVATTGDFYVSSSGLTPAYGDWVFVSRADGSIIFDADPSATHAGYALTAWKVTQVTSDDVCVISNHHSTATVNITVEAAD